ncbi:MULTISPECIES: alpha/beta hydrolase [unclassified Streptomyces]|uniref:alpha/beta hydrolase n=1 Tax=unclassified Streptomyces TaxID=2593676 RepID=UPI0022B71E80|nr:MULTISPECIES: alpha/beta fold hydrolase [unclassified Streptomyces]MCZ7413839.1 alpha/beta fold hydrolase [Streptomyces sp. WMMC897]MCZ7430835.1 alpha/beta fold hydrolase [Streptomyces sp. WMMC1477]
MPLLPGSEPMRHEGSDEIGVLISHGFTGTPQSVRPWGRYLAERGLTVSVPLLPGHGTRWEDMAVTGWQDWYAAVEHELLDLRKRCRQVFVAGLSMGGAMALRLAARHGDAVSGVAVVNPAISFPRRQGYALPVMRYLVRSAPGITSDIRKEGVTETGYDRVSLHAAYALRNFLRLTHRELPQVTQPLLVMHSRVDHVVPPGDSATILGAVSSADVTETVLENSYHVATLDNDAEQIFADSHAFITRLAARKTARDGS